MNRVTSFWKTEKSQGIFKVPKKSWKSKGILKNIVEISKQQRSRKLGKDDCIR
jgi:hypothetical protein